MQDREEMIGVVIVSYRSDDLTVRFVREELVRITWPYKVVVVDNGASEDEAAALAARIPEAVVIPTENRGFAAGNNVGIRYLEESVHPTHILLTNNDIVLYPGVVEQLVRSLEDHLEAGVAGPAVLGLDGKRQGPYPYLGLWDRYVWMYLSTPFLSPETKARRFGLSYPDQAQEGPQYAISGCFLLADPSVLRVVGGFDEDTFLYAEENILSDRMARLGKRFWFDPSVSVVHQHGATIKSRYSERESALLQFDSMACYYRKYRGYSRLSIRLARAVYSLILRLK